MVAFTFGLFLMGSRARRTAAMIAAATKIADFSFDRPPEQIPITTGEI
jgi:hypothetical protein